MNKNDIIKNTRDGKTLIHHNGFTYKLRYEGSKLALYWCTLNRNNCSDCTAKLCVYKATEFKESIGCHSQTCNHCNKSEHVSCSPLVDKNPNLLLQSNFTTNHPVVRLTISLYLRLVNASMMGWRVGGCDF